MSIAFKERTELTSEEWWTRERILRKFEDDWLKGLRPELDDYVPADDRLRRLTLPELVRIDLDGRLRDGEAAQVEQYWDRYEELQSDPEVELALIESELALRQRREPDLSADEFIKRFPDYRTELLSMWERMRQARTTLLRRKCPNCHEPIEFPGVGLVEEVTCPCGTAVRSGPVQLAIGARLGKYELLGELGCGSYGIVYRARDTELDRDVALKVLKAGHLALGDAVERFLREARSAAHLHHPHIVTIHDSGQADETYYLAYALVKGPTLARRLANSRLPIREAAALVAQVADALHYAHRQGVVHRDVKPANILLDSDGAPHLTDFGLARRDAGETAMTGTGDILGTLAYMPPEQARGHGNRVDGRSDLYSLGVILYEMMTGERPFVGDDNLIVLRQIQDEEPRPPRQINDRIEPDLETICLKCLEKDPNRRYDDAGLLAADLRRFLDDLPPVAKPVGRIGRIDRWRRRKPAVARLWAAVVLVSGAGLGFSAWLLWQSGKQTAVLTEAMRATVTILENDLNQATSAGGYLAYMPKRSRDDHLKRIEKLQRQLEKASPKTYSALRIWALYILGWGESPKTFSVLRLRALYILGWGYSLTEDSNKAKAALADAIKLGEELLPRDTKDQVVAGLLASCHNVLANILHDGSSFEAAEPHYEAAIRLRRDAVVRQPNLPLLRAELGETLIDRANSLKERQLDHDARELYREAVKIFRHLSTDDPQNLRFIRDEAATLTNLGELDNPQIWMLPHSPEDLQKVERARSEFKAAAILYPRLHPDPESTPRIASEQAKCYLGLSIIERKLRNFEGATFAAQAAVDALKLVVKYNPLVAACHDDLALAYHDLRTTHAKAGRPNDASRAFKDAASEINEALHLSPNNPVYEFHREMIQPNQPSMEK